MTTSPTVLNVASALSGMVIPYWSSMTHEELEDVQRIGAEVFFYLRVQRDDRGVHPQLLGQDGPDFLIHRFHQSS